MTPQARSGERDVALSSVLKALRLHRRLTVRQVAQRMDLHRRTYERFEAGEGLLKVERIFSFAHATNTDPYALLASVRPGSADCAGTLPPRRLRCPPAPAAVDRRGAEPGYYAPEFRARGLADPRREVDASAALTVR